MSLAIILLISAVFVLVVLGVPIVFSIGSAIAAYALVDGFPPFNVLAQQTVLGVDSYVLLALPLFIWGGILMEIGGASDALMNLIIKIIGKVPGGTAISSVVASMFFGALTGSAVATTAAIGQIMLPKLVKQGYEPRFIVPLQGAAGTLGSVIPPGISLVAYGAIAGASIKDLFAGAVVPGLITGGLLIVLTLIISQKRKYGVGHVHMEGDIDLTKLSFYAVTVSAIPALIMPLIILGGIFAGIFTPTEAAAVACVYGILVGWLVYRKLTWRLLADSLVQATRSTAAITFIIAIAAAFAWILSAEQVPQAIASVMLNATDNPVIILILMNVILLLLGTFMETISIIVILTPIFAPIALSVGIDLVHFGVIMILNLAIGSITPPLGVCLFTAARILRIDIGETMPDLLYVVGTMVIALLIVILIPATVMWVV